MNFEKRWYGFALIVLAILLLQNCTPSQAKEKILPKKSNFSSAEQALIDEYKFIWSYENTYEEDPCDDEGVGEESGNE